MAKLLEGMTVKVKPAVPICGCKQATIFLIAGGKHYLRCRHGGGTIEKKYLTPVQGIPVDKEIARSAKRHREQVDRLLKRLEAERKKAAAAAGR